MKEALTVAGWCIFGTCLTIMALIIIVCLAAYVVTNKLISIGILIVFIGCAIGLWLRDKLAE